jgi:hypothetical protein
MSLHLYGENGLTFLLFQALDRVGVQPLLDHLKSFRDGTKLKCTLDAGVTPQIWLFPNFGKSWGFGEPDVLLLLGKRRFWIEVETMIDLRQRTTLDNALRQLFRFHCLATALRAARSSEGGRISVTGNSITSLDTLRPKATVLVRGHGVFQRIGKDLSRVDVEDHFVLLSAGARGKGGKAAKYWQQLQNVAKPYFERLSQVATVPTLPMDRCWYVYWKEDLKGMLPGDIDPLKSYVEIKRSTRARVRQAQ